MKDDGKHIEAVNLLCRAPESLMVEISDMEASNKVLNAATSYRIWVLMRVCGMFHLQNSFNINLIDALREAQRRHWYKTQYEVKQMVEEKTFDAAVRGDRKRFEVTRNLAATEANLTAPNPTLSLTLTLALTTARSLGLSLNLTIACGVR